MKRQPAKVLEPGDLRRLLEHVDHGVPRAQADPVPAISVVQARDPLLPAAADGRTLTADSFRPSTATLQVQRRSD
jgi:hypothetical protein